MHAHSRRWKWVNNDSDQDHSAWLFQRQSNGTWAVVRRLVQHIDVADLDEPPMTLDMQGGVAAVLFERFSWIFERSGTNWVSVRSPIDTDGMDAAVNGGTILVTAPSCAWYAHAYRKNTNGAWTLVRQTEPQPDEFCENEDTRGSIDVSGNANIVYTWTNELFTRGSARIFEGPYGTANTPVMTRLLAPPGTVYDLWDPVAIDLPSALTSGEPNNGAYAFTRDSSGTWSLTDKLVRPDALALGWGVDSIDIRGGLAVLTARGSPAVFQRNADNTFRYVARLFASDRQGLWSSDVSGRRIATSGVGAVYIFDLPADFTQPATVQDGFEDGNASDWTPLAGSSFSVATTHSRVYRQSGTAGNATSIWGDTDRTNQAVEADIKPTAYAYKTRADYDNVLVSANPRTTLASYAFSYSADSRENWETLGTWTRIYEREVFVQSDLTSGARAITGVATDDQIVHARMLRTSAAGTNNWFGLATRYRDAGNYYYFTLRNNNTIALRKLVNNAIVELDSAPLTVAANTWYRARFEAVGTQLRVYINDSLVLEATDASHTSGRYGPVMYRAGAEYDDILAVQP